MKQTIIHAIPNPTPSRVVANKNRVDYTKKVIICRGIQGSGKTTWANQWVGEDPKNRVRFNKDDIRNMLGGHNKNGYWVPDRESLIENLKKEFLWSAMGGGFNIVIDNMNLNELEVNSITKIVDSFNNPKPNQILCSDLRYHYVIEYKDFFTPLEECIERDSKRENPITEEVIRKTYDKYKDIVGGK